MASRAPAIQDKKALLQQVLKLAPHFPCEDGNCKCTSWKRKHSALSADFSCGTCSHGLPRHGNLWRLTPEHLDKLTEIVIQIEYTTGQAQQASDGQNKKSHMKRVETLKEKLLAAHKEFAEASKQIENSKPVPDTPPFETPNFMQIMKNFVSFRYENKYGDSKKRAIDKLHYTLISSANKYFLPKLEGRNSSIVDPIAYEVYYPYWERYCKPNISTSSKDDHRAKTSKTIEKIRETKPLLCSSFGRYFIRAFLPLLKENLMSQYQLTREMEIFAPTFFDDLTEELYNKNSIVCMDSFDEAMDHVRKIQAQLDREASDKEQIAAMGGTYNPIFLPLKRKRDFLREIAPATEEHYAKYSTPEGQALVAKNSHMNQTIPVIQPPSPKEDKMEIELNEPLEDMQIEARDQLAKDEEKQGVLTSRIITNDDTPENLILLIHVRNIFCRQLPKMPKEYITRLVLDKHHRSLLLIKHDKVVGGICFHSFHDEGFVEIAFLAITATEQVKGYGTHLMNHFKSKMQEEKLCFFVTYADNFAIGYFKKQGFTKYVTMERERWAGLIKDYDGGTLMECHMHPTIDFLKLRENIKKQRACIYQKVKENSRSHILRDGISAFKKGRTRRLDISEIPGIDECRTPAEVKQEFPKPEQVKQNQALFQKIINAMLQLPDIWPFEHPVTPEEAPDYFDVVKDPIDLEGIQKRLNTGQYYITEHIFFADIRRMLDNCKLYNKEDTPYYRCAANVQNELCSKGWAKYFQ